MAMTLVCSFGQSLLYFSKRNMRLWHMPVQQTIQKSHAIDTIIKVTVTDAD